MRKKRFIWIIGLVVVLAAVVFGDHVYRRGPSYQGHDVVYWFEASGPFLPERGQSEAFRAMGSNAVPYLVSQLDRRESPWNRFYCANFLRLPVWFQTRFAFPEPAAARRSRAILALGQMGSSATMAVPDLIRALTDTNSSIRGDAAQALGRIGAPARAAVPKLDELVQQRKEPDPRVRWNAALAIWTIDHQAYAFLPYCIADLQGNDDRRWNGVSFLGEFGPQAKSAVSALIEILAHDKNERLRAKAATTLGEIGPEASNAVPALQLALKDEFLNVQTCAREALKKIRLEGGESR